MKKQNILSIILILSLCLILLVGCSKQNTLHPIPTENVVLPTAAVIIVDDQTNITPADQQSDFTIKINQIIQNYNKQDNIRFESNSNGLIFIIFIDVTDEEMNTITTSNEPIETSIYNFVDTDLITQVQDAGAQQFIICLINKGITFMAYDIFNEELKIDYINTAVG